MRMIQIQDNISEQKNLKDKLESEQEKLHVEYNKVSRTNGSSHNLSCSSPRFSSPSKTQYTLSFSFDCKKILLVRTPFVFDNYDAKASRSDKPESLLALRVSGGAAEHQWEAPE